MLGPAQYAVVASAVAALYILNLPALVVQTVSARFTSVAAGKGRLGNVPGLILQVSGLGLVVGVAIAATLLLFGGPISAYLQISDRRVVGFLALASVIALLVAATRGALQGLRRFVALSINVLVDMSVRVASVAGLVLAGNTLFGTTMGPFQTSGTIFKINTDGTGFTNLHSFTQTYSTNSDGVNPKSTLILSGNTLYGTTMAGGPSGSGVIFSINTNGDNFTQPSHRILGKCWNDWFNPATRQG